MSQLSNVSEFSEFGLDFLVDGQNFDYKLDSVSWIRFLEDFSSKTVYEQRINDFLNYHQQQINQDFVTALIDYFDLKRHELKPNGEIANAPTSMRSWFSMFKAYWLHCHGQALEKIAPLIEINLTKWEKTYTVNKAAAFTKNQLRKINTVIDLFF